MHRRPRLSVTIAVVAALTVALVAALAVVWWQGRPVQVTAPASGADPACLRLAGELPARVHDEPRVATSSGSPAVAAWGDPAIIWRCGVPSPGPTTDDCIAVDGVDWVLHRLDDGISFTTYGRDPAVQVLVPRSYAPEPLLLPPLSQVVASIPQGEHRCR